MAQRCKAVVVRELNKPVVVEEITVEAPRAEDVMIKLAACGVCHSDLSAINGTVPFPLPVILGHEGAGVVVDVGAGVTDLAVGDHVVSSFVSMCGKCRYCTTGRPYLCDQSAKAGFTLPDGTVRTRDKDGKPLNVFAGCGVMAEYATLHKDSVVKIESGVPLDRAAIVSCGVMTGVGAAFNTARVEPGSICIVFGAGGVGLSAIQGCALAGAAQIVAVDIADNKLDMARQFGATHVLNSKSVENPVKALRELTGGGADYAFECVGFGEIVAQAYGALRKGGTAVVVGVAPVKDMTSLRTLSIYAEGKTLTGSRYGSARPKEDFPRLLSLYKSKRLKLDELITHRYKIDEAPQAFADLAAGKNARGVIVF
jgi:S-(hydroxymethyl)glutathione dehydrogenase/alcohol dehydrogenase